MLLLRDVGGVVAGIGVELAQVELEGLGDHPVEEVAVVAGDQDGAGVGAEELLEPLDAQQVEVVGRLVEQEQVVLEGEQPAQGQPHRPAAGEGGDGGVELRDREAEPEQDRLGPRLHLVTAGREEGLHARRRSRSRACGSPCFEAGHDGLQPAVGHGPGAEVAEHVLEDGPLAQRVDLLRQIADRAFPVAEHLAAHRACSWPIKTLNSVDLPAPFLPSRPMRSPRLIEASTPSYNVCRP